MRLRYAVVTLMTGNLKKSGWHIYPDIESMFLRYFIDSGKIKYFDGYEANCQHKPYIYFSNDCTAGTFYKNILNCQYPHGLIWTNMEREFFPEFINNYDNINFSNILYFNKGALLDNKIPFSHPHNDDKSFEKLYNKRNSRFNKDEYTPVFILKQHKFFNPSTIINIAENIHTEYDVYFIIDKNITVPNLEKHKNFKIIHCDASANPTPYAARQLYDRLKLEGKIS